MKVLSTIIFCAMLIANLDAQTERIDKLFFDYSAGECPGASVIVSIDGKIVFKKSFGFANLEDDTRIEPRTNFRLASVTKQFTAASILILIQRGLLKLDTKLTDIYENFPDYGERITIKNLLNHTSGLVDYEDLISDTTTIQVKDPDVLSMMFAQHATYFEPGTQFKYSNTGYALLAMIAEKISGKSFAQFLFADKGDRVFQYL